MICGASSFGKTRCGFTASRRVGLPFKSFKQFKTFKPCEKRKSYQKCPDNTQLAQIREIFQMQYGYKHNGLMK